MQNKAAQLPKKNINHTWLNGESECENKKGRARNVQTYHPELAIVRFFIRQRLFHARCPPLVVVAPRALPLKLHIVQMGKNFERKKGNKETKYRAERT